ncbi:MAG: hypothetical protein RL228_1313 [Actinomycetota bacterium]|jgi:prolyl-tRNA editing enzyme YbaK/EbsC (Cys-tRNA(Pro) deacylase)
MPANHPSVLRVQSALREAGHHDNITILADSARTAAEAAAAQNINVGQVASSIVFSLAQAEGEPHPLLVITSGAHRVDTALVAQALDVEKLGRADADFVRRWSGFAIGGVSPLGWKADPETKVNERGYPVELTILIDELLGTWDEVWAAAGHPHSVFPTTYSELIRMTGAKPLKVGD